MAFEVERVGERTLRVAGEIDECAFATFEAEIQRLVHHHGEVTLEMSDVIFIDSAALRCLLTSARSIAGHGMVTIDQPSRYVLRVLEIAGFLEPPVGLVIHVPRVSVKDGPGSVSLLAALIDRASEATAASRLLISRSLGLVAAARTLRAASVTARAASSRGC